jgi:hypothetical protein
VHAAGHCKLAHEVHCAVSSVFFFSVLFELI